MSDQDNRGKEDAGKAAANETFRVHVYGKGWIGQFDIPVRDFDYLTSFLASAAIGGK